MILESLVTTTDADGKVNLAPMGPKVNAELTEFVLKPFGTSQTYANLRATGCAVVHVTDDSLLIARTAIHQLAELPEMVRLIDLRFWRLKDCCRWFALEVSQWHEDPLRPTAFCRIVDTGVERPFFGFCRAKHAVLEAAILATRTHLIDHATLIAELDRLQPLVEKTGGAAEFAAYELIRHYVERSCLTGN